MTNIQYQKKIIDQQIIAQNLRIKLEIKDLEQVEAAKRFQKEQDRKDGTIRMLQTEIARLHQVEMEKDENLCEAWREIEQLRRRIAELEDQLGYYKARTVKDSSTSSRPPSSDGLRRKPVSTREKSGKRPGGQPGHPGHTLEQLPPTEIINRMPPPVCTCGGHVLPTDHYTPKQVVHLRVVVDVIEERSYQGVCDQCGKEHTGVFSPDFINPVQYSSEIKALSVYLGEYGNVPVNKVSEILATLSGGAIRLSGGTIDNFYKNFSAAAEPVIEEIKHHLITGGVLGADETGCRVNGKNNWAQIFTNHLFTMYGVGEKRGGLCEEMNLLIFFTGVLVHDHFAAYYRHQQMTHAECNAHILRYLKAVTEIFQHEWAAAFTTLLKEALKLKYQSLEGGLDGVSPADYDAISARYDEILQTGTTEYEAAVAGKSHTKYYDEERRLLARLKAFKTEHLLFLTRKDIPFSNNVSEQGAIQFKRKAKAIGCFRSEEGARVFARILSVIQTSRKHKSNVFRTIVDIFNGHMPEFLRASPVPSS